MCVVLSAGEGLQSESHHSGVCRWIPLLRKKFRGEFGSRLHTICIIYYFISVTKDVMWSDIHRKISESYLRSVLNSFRRWFRSTWRLPGERIAVSAFAWIFLFCICALESYKCYYFIFIYSDSEELASTLHDNSVLISIPVKYEAGLIFSVWVVGLLTSHDGLFDLPWEYKRRCF